VLAGSLDVVMRGFREFTDLGAAACHELSADGETVAGCRSHHTLRSGISFLTGFRLFRKEGDRYRIADWDRESDRWVDNVSGFAWAIRRSVFDQIGGFDERLFLYFEEQDMAIRLQQAGYRIRYFSQARIVHLNARSTASLGAFGRRRRWVKSFVCLRAKHGLSPSAGLDRLVLYSFLAIWWLGFRAKRIHGGAAI
jgi:GT2 family glycosyltransferase